MSNQIHKSVYSKLVVAHHDVMYPHTPNSYTLSLGISQEYCYRHYLETSLDPGPPGCLQISSPKPQTLASLDRAFLGCQTAPCCMYKLILISFMAALLWNVSPVNSSPSGSVLIFSESYLRTNLYLLLWYQNIDRLSNAINNNFLKLIHLVTETHHEHQPILLKQYWCKWQAHKEMIGIFASRFKWSVLILFLRPEDLHGGELSWTESFLLTWILRETFSRGPDSVALII